MVIGRSVSFSDPTRPLPRVATKHAPKFPPKIVCAFQNPRNIFEKKKFSREKNLDFLAF